VDFVNDEDLLIQIDAIEAIIQILDVYTEEEVDQEVMPCILNFLDTDSQVQIETTQRFAKLLGKVVDSLKQFGFHLKYKK